METRRDNLKGVQKGSTKCSMWSCRHGWLRWEGLQQATATPTARTGKVCAKLGLSIKQLCLKRTQRKSCLPHRCSMAEQPTPGLASWCCSRAWGTAQEHCADGQHPELTAATSPHRHIQNQKASSNSGASIRTSDVPKPYRCCRFVVPALVDTKRQSYCYGQELLQPCTSSPALPHHPPPPPLGTSKTGPPHCRGSGFPPKHLFPSKPT